MIFLEGGRVVDPATRVDGVRTVILDGGRIKEVREQAVSSGERSAHEVVDCRGLLVLFAAATPVGAVPGRAGAAPADVPTAPFSGYSSGAVVHASSTGKNRKPTNEKPSGIVVA